MKIAMTPEHKETGPLCNFHGCVDKRELSSSPSFSASFHLRRANKRLAFWLFLVASFSSIITKTLYFFRGCRIKPAEKVSVSLSNRTITNARIENDDTLSCSESSWSSPKCDRHLEISDLDRESYLDSLLSLEEEDSEWLLDSKPYGCSYEEDPSSYLSTHIPSYWDSFLMLEGKDSEWLLDSEQELEDGFPSPSYEGSWGSEFLPSLEIDDHAEELSDNEPLFWPFEEKFNWNSEEPWSLFSTSPRSTTSRVKECKQKGYGALCSVNSEASRLSMLSKSSGKTVNLECKEEKVVVKLGEDQSNKLLFLSKTFLNEDFDSNKDLPLGREYFGLDQELPIETLVGLKEFDGHEGLDSEFNGDVFMLVESLQ